MQAFGPGIAGKGAPAVNLFLNLPGPPGTQLKINVYVQQFT